MRLQLKIFLSIIGSTRREGNEERARMLIEQGTY